VLFHAQVVETTVDALKSSEQEERWLLSDLHLVELLNVIYLFGGRWSEVESEI
jgi:hypothetical protein